MPAAQRMCPLSCCTTMRCPGRLVFQPMTSVLRPLMFTPDPMSTAFWARASHRGWNKKWRGREASPWCSLAHLAELVLAFFDLIIQIVEAARTFIQERVALVDEVFLFL